MEPIYTLEITVPDQYAGDIMSDMTTRRGRVMGMLPDGSGRTTISAQAPLAEVQRYATDLRSTTQGRATYTMQFERYEEVPAKIAEEVIEGRQGTPVPA